MTSSTPTAPITSGEALKALSDAEIVQVLASLGIDADKSKYEWNPVLQVRTTVPDIRRIAEAYNKALAQRAGAADKPVAPDFRIGEPVALSAEMSAALDAALSDAMRSGTGIFRIEHIEPAEFFTPVAASADKPSTKSTELSEQLRRQHKTETWDWDSLLLAADEIDRLAASADAAPAGAVTVPAVVHQALDIALDLAMAAAEQTHRDLKGYKPHRHAAVDAEVQTVKDAIDALNAQQGKANPVALNSGDGKERQAKASSVPDGYVLVPTKYTPEMRAAWDRAPQSDDDDRDFAGAYGAMIRAAPTNPAGASAAGGNLDPVVEANHALEEALDLTNYLQAEMQRGGAQ